MRPEAPPARRERPRRPARFRAHLLALTACTILPVLALAGALLLRQAEERRAAEMASLADGARALAAAVDREIAGTLRALEAASLAIGPEDLAEPERLRPRFEALLRQNPSWHLLVLARPNGTQVLNTLVPSGAAPPAALSGAVPAAEGGPEVSDPFVGLVAAVPIVAVTVPLAGPGGTWAVRAGIRTHRFETAINETLPAGFLGAVVGRNGRFVAHTSTPQGDRTAARGPENIAAFAESAAPGAVAFLETRRVTGEPMDAALRRLTAAPWTAVASVPRGVLSRAVWGPLWSLAAWGAAALILALLAAWLLGRRLGRRVSALALAAEAAGRGEVLPVPDGVAEVDRVARALDAAARQVRAREADLRRAGDERLRLAVEGAGMATWDAEIATGESVWSANHFAMLGLPATPDGRFTTAAWEARVHPEDLPRVRAALAAVRESEGGNFATEYRIIRADDGTERWLSAHGRVLRDASGRPTRSVGIALDVTERRRAEAALREGEARLRLAHQIARIGTFDWRLGEAAATVSPEYAGLSGLPEGTARDTHGAALARVHREDRAAHAAAVRAALEGNAPGYELEFRLVRPSDGAVRRVAVRAEIARDAAGRPARLTGVVRDVTEERAAQDDLLRLNAALEARLTDEATAREEAQRRAAQAERMQALGQLAGGIAHDFNNVLQAVQGGAALIERRPMDADGVRRLARMILEATGRGVTVTRRLLAFARRDELRAEAVEPGPLLSELCEVLAHTLGASVACRHAAAPGTPSLLADKGQLETVLVNLAANGRDAMPGGGVLHLTAAPEEVVEGSAGAPTGLRPGRYVRISVADTGTGMDPATAARVGEPFFTTKPLGKGTGLGLSMARGFAEQSGGALAIRTAPGEGTTVSLWLPVAPEAAPGRTMTREAEARGAEARRVLLTEDEPLVREMVAGELEAAGYAVLPASGGQEALALLAAGEAVDVLVTDLSMPGMSGVALIEAAQSRRPGLPAVLLTGYAGDGAALAVGGALSGTFSLLRKPVTGAALAQRIEALLAAREGRRAEVPAAD